MRRWNCSNKRPRPPEMQGYHVGGFSYIRQLLDILCSFILYFLWTERCRKHFDNQYSYRKSFGKPGLLPLKLEWTLGRPLIPFGLPGTLAFKLGLIKPLGQNGAA